MGEQPTQGPSSSGDLASADLEYDLAHEEEAGGARVTDAVPSRREAEAVYVPTETSGYDGDYEYDLAHDVPGR